jgi:hypothetical protein
MPRKGQRVDTPSGIGIVVGIYPLKETVLVEMESKAEAEFPLNQIKVLAEHSRPQPPEPANNEENGAFNGEEKERAGNQPEAKAPENQTPPQEPERNGPTENQNEI